VSVLRENMANCIEAFQGLLKAHQSDEALVDAVMERWKDQHHVFRALVMACRTGDRKRFPDDSGGPSRGDEENILTNKNPEV